MGLFTRKPDLVPDLHYAQDDSGLRAACDAARSGDWAPARDLMVATRTDPDRRARYVWVLATSATDDPWGAQRNTALPVDVTVAWPDLWAEADPNNPDAVLVRARSLVTRGWEVRGGGWGSTVGDAAAEEFRRLLLLALSVNSQAAALAPDDPTPWAQRLLMLTALSAPREEFDRSWAEVVARDPLHREAHEFKLMYLCEKWHGSHEQMFTFAREAAAAAPAGSPLVVLPLQANAEWVMLEHSRIMKLPSAAAQIKAFANFDEGYGGERFQSELDAALQRWFAQPARKHGMWYDDLNSLAYGLARGNRLRDAKPVFEAIGPYMSELPWAWWEGDAQKTFLKQRRKSLRG